MRPLWTIAVVLIAGQPLAARAQESRIVLVTKLTLDEKAFDSSGLEVVVIKALRSSGARVIELGAALAAQRAAFSDSIQEGRIPKELSSLNADFVSSFQLSCSTGPATEVEAMGETSRAHNYPCDLNEKIIRVDTGDVAYANSRSWVGTPQLSAQLAMAAALKSSVAKGVAEDLAAWKAGAKAEPVTMDLIVSKLNSRDQAAAIARRLATLEGVTDARVLVFNREYAKLAVNVESPGALRGVIDSLQKDPALPLRITYETERLLQVEFDFDRAYARGTSVVWTSPPGKGPASKEQAVADTGTQALRSALQNLGYLDVKAVERVGPKGDLKTHGFFAARRDPLRLTVRLSRETQVGGDERSRRAGSVKQQWLVALELLAEPQAGAPSSLAAATGRAEEPFVAVDQAVRELDARYRQALEKAATRKLLGFSDDAPAPVEGLVVEALELAPVFPARLPRYRKDGIGTLRLTNKSAQKVTQAKARFTLGTTVLAEVAVADLEPGEKRVIPVVVDTLPPRDAENRYQQLTVALTWRAGELHGKEDAVGPLILQRDNAIDWSAPQSLAAFIDAQDAKVRQLATAALARRPAEKVVGGGLRDAALIFDSLWRAPMSYVRDPVAIDFGADVDVVQAPGQSLERAAGDCDDLTVLLASLFESVGISTAIITVPGHVLLAVDAGALAGGHVLYDLPASLFVTFDGALFAPLEATAIGASFAEAWQKGAKAAREAGKKAQAFRTRAAWRSFPTVSKPGAATTKVAVSSSPVVAWSQTAAAVRGASTPWAKALNAAVVEGQPSTAIASVAAPTEPLALAVFDWLAGRREKAQQSAAKLCNQAVAEACYDLAVMLVLESEDEKALDAETVRNALAVLPENIAAMMLDHGAALGDEASPEAAARRRMEQVLKRAREQLQAKRAQAGKGAIATIGYVAGRKGKPAEPRVAAPMFFWARAD